MLTLSIWLSRVFHPLIVAPLSLFVVQRLSGYTSAEATLWTALAFSVTLLPVFAFVLRRVRTGRYKDADVSTREDRHLLYLLAALSLVALVVALAFLPAPPILRLAIVAALVAIVTGAVVNWTVHKVSLHVLTLAACGALLFFLLPPLGAGLLLASGGVAWARVHLRRHTVPDVLWGFGVGVLCAVAVFWLPLGLR